MVGDGIYCVNGHKLSETLKRFPNGEEYCHKCKLETAQRWKKANKEKIRASAAVYYLRTKEVNSKKSLEWRNKHREELRQKSRERYSREKEHCAAVNKAWRERNKERVTATAKAYREKNKDKIQAWYMRRRYGISIDDYMDILKKQGGKCAICGSKDFRGKLPHIDHDHITGEVRGLLCLNCNAGIGNLKDNSEIIRRALQYLGGAA